MISIMLSSYIGEIHLKEQSMYRKNIFFIILTLLMWIAGIIGIIVILNNSTFDYFGLPLWIIYLILAIYGILVILVTIITIRRILKAKNRYRKYYDI